MERIKVVVFGIGNEFWKNKEYIENKFIVLGWSDNEEKIVEGLEYGFIKPKEIVNCSCNKVIVTTKRYYEEIRYQLIKYGISYDDIDLLEPLDNDNLYSKVVKDLELFTQKNLLAPTEKKFMIHDVLEGAGQVPNHYFMQDLYVARKIFNNSPEEHYDIGSRLDGFLAHLLVFRSVNFIDIRPLSETIEGLKFTQADATDLKGIDDGVIESMSCLHALEHFGLGRYGDIVDPKGYIKVAQSIQRVIRPGGVLYLSLPIGNEDKIVFNAHRIFSPSTIIGLFDCMDLEELTVVDPVGCGMNKIDKRSISSWNYKDYSCGIFIFQKKLSS